MLALLLAISAGMAMAAGPDYWQREWPDTDFSRTEIDFDEIRSGGPPKDGIPAIDDPEFQSALEVTHLSETEPVIGVIIDGEAKAYPLQVLMWHEIVNDTLAGVPITVTFCPLCNASIVFDRRISHPLLGDMVLDFGTTGKLRNSDLVMYDRQTQSWWQQFLGRAIVGEMTGQELEMIPVRIESFRNFKARAPKGSVLVPRKGFPRPYGKNPYTGYDSNFMPFLYGGKLPEGIAPLARVVVAENKAWSLDYLRQSGRIVTADGLILTWEKGQNSALDTAVIGDGVDIGNVTVQRRKHGRLIDVRYGVDFAFAFYAFHPDIPITLE